MSLGRIIAIHVMGKEIIIVFDSGLEMMNNKRGSISLLEHSPALEKEWVYEKNSNCTPESVSYGCKKLVWWKCSICGYEWEAKVLNRVHGSGCPACNGKKAISGLNDLETKYPIILDEWDYSKNTIKPNEIKANSNLKIWWRCQKCGYSWAATPNNRIGNGTGCPSCSGYRHIKGKNDLVTLKSPLLAEWDYEKNEITPYDVTPNSRYEIWWKCSVCGYSWSNSVINRTNSSTRCPICDGKRFVRGKTDFASKYPLLAKEWDYAKNETIDPYTISPNSSLSVWWTCPECGQSYKAGIESRVWGQGCPKCIRWINTSVEEQIIFYYLKSVFSDAINGFRAPFLTNYEFDIFIPALNLVVEFDGYKWHSNTKRDLIKDSIASENGLSVVRFRGSQKKPLNDGCYEIYYNYRQDRYKYIQIPIKHLFDYIKKEYSLEFKVDIDINRDFQQIIEFVKKEKRKKTILFTNPDIVKEWDFDLNGTTIPSQVTAGSSKKIWWRCKKCGNTWEATVNSRISGKNGCPFCSGHRIKKGFNDLATKRPDLMLDWDTEKNELSGFEISPNSMKIVSWKCYNCGYKWNASPNYRFRHSKCPNCKK